MKRNRAVTLLELLIAASITLVVLLTIYSSFHTGILGSRNIEETVSLYEAARQILERINLDLKNSFRYSNGQTKFIGSKNEIGFLTAVDTFNEDTITQEYAFVSYKLEEGRLMRVCRRGKESLNEKSEVEYEEMAPVEGITFNYGYRAAISEPVKFDKDTWDDNTVLPLAVKIKLTLGNKVKQDFERTVYLPRSP